MCHHGLVRRSTFLAAICFATFTVAACGHSGGDPGGQVLRKLEPVTRAVPPGSSSVVIHTYPATWQNKCPDNPAGQSGWSEDLVSINFTTAMPYAAVIADVNASLIGMGWTRHDTTSPQGGPIASWNKSVGVGSQATAFVYPVPQGSETWFLTGGWKPPGFALPGC